MFQRSSRALTRRARSVSGQMKAAVLPGVARVSRSSGAKPLDHAEPIGGGVRWSQGLVDQPPSPPPPGLRGRGGIKIGHIAPTYLRLREKPAHGALRVLVLHLQPGLFGEVQVQPRQHDRAARRLAYRRQQGRGGGRRAGGPGRHHDPHRRSRGPVAGQTPQEGDAPRGDIHDAQGFETGRPGLEGHVQKGGRDAPVPREFPLGQVLEDQIGAKVRLLDLPGVQERGESVGQFQGPAGLQASAKEILVRRDEPRKFETPPLRRDGRWEVKTEVTRLKGGLALIQIAQHPDLGKDRGASAGGLQEGVGEGPRGAAGGQKNEGVGQRLRAARREFPP